MSTEFTSIPDDFSTPVNPGATPFAPVPAWERGKPRRDLAGQVAAEPRSFAPERAERPVATRPVTRPTTLSDDARAYEARLDTVDATDTTFAAEPVYVSRAASRNTSTAPIAIMAGIILLGGVATAGWYYSRPHDAGMAQLTPGAASTTTTTEVASTAPATAAADLTAPAAAPVPAPVAAKTTTTTTTTTSRTASRAPAKATVTRSRSAASAADIAADVSAKAPVQAVAMPAPAAAAPPVAAVPAPLVLTLPAQTAPAPAPAPTETPPTR